MLTIEKVIFLKSTDLFRAVPEERLVEIAGIVREKEAHTDELIIREGDVGVSMFIIVHGRVRVYRNGRDIAVLKERDVFGELAALDPEPRSASIFALEETFLLELNGFALYELMADHPELVRSVISVLCERVRSTTS